VRESSILFFCKEKREERKRQRKKKRVRLLNTHTHSLCVLRCFFSSFSIYLSMRPWLGWWKKDREKLFSSVPPSKLKDTIIIERKDWCYSYWSYLNYNLFFSEMFNFFLVFFRSISSMYKYRKSTGNSRIILNNDK